MHSLVYVMCMVILLTVCNSLQSVNTESTTVSTSSSPISQSLKTTLSPRIQSEVVVENSTSTNSQHEHKSSPANEIAQPLVQLPPRLEAMIAAIHQSKNEYGHVEVRKGAFLFWWMYFADGSKENAHTKPWVIWIQGGPSIPGSGLGNFVEIGPLTVTLKERPSSWVKGKNILFVDSPVGTGYSYAEEENLYCKTDKDVAADLIQLMKALLEKFPEFKTTPTHIFSQSYGTKIASYFAYYASKDIEQGSLEMNLKTVALGGSWINTKLTSLATTEYLYQTGFLDKPEYVRLRSMVNNLTSMIDRKEYREAFKYRLDITGEMYSDDKSFDSYNIFQPPKDYAIAQLTSLMNGLVSFSLGPSYSRKRWMFMDGDVLGALVSEFMKPAQHVVENILAETKLNVVIYNGDLDSVTPMAGAVNWVHDLNWTGRDKFWSAKRQRLNGLNNGFFKQHDRLSLWWILKAGHWRDIDCVWMHPQPVAHGAMVPTDNPEAMDQLLQYIVHEKKDLFSKKTPDVIMKPKLAISTPAKHSNQENNVK